jgi:cytoskeletal protein CcmA (bactofilin family)
MPDKDPCFIGSQITVRGQISGNQDLVIEGRVEGRIGLQNRITVEEGATVEADLDVADADVKGAVRGEVVASRSAVLHPSARVTGTLRAPRIVIEEGAKFTGNIEMEVDLPPDVRIQTT